MKVIHSTEQAPAQERTLLVGLEHSGRDHWEQSESMLELKELVKTAGGDVIESITQKLNSPTAPFYIGKGKAEQLSGLCEKERISSVVFNDELTPAQSRNLEGVFKRKVIDRTQLILDIFAQRAKSKEGKLQIELAQLQYLLPRLTGMWTHLSRQSGGIGTRGPGETQLEVDRRRVTEKITRLERELDEVRRQRDVQRQGRLRQHWPIIALVGYTNAGKSTLLNLLTSSEAYTADQLFATLDPTTRQFMLPNKQRVLITDTVGFLKDLPHHLIESFKSTLEEVTQADLLIHLVDLSHPRFQEQMRSVDVVLEELQAAGKQTLLVFNKIDQVQNPALIENMLNQYPHSVAISAKAKMGMDALLSEIENQCRSWRLRVKLLFPNNMTALIAELHRSGRVLEIKYEGDFVAITAHIPPHLQGKLKEYITESGESPFGSGPLPYPSKKQVA